METDVLYIRAAYDGRQSMLKAIFGSSDSVTKGKPTAADIRSFAKTHNALLKNGKIRLG